MERIITPLIVPQDAIFFDNSLMTLDQTIDIFTQQIEEIKKQAD